MKRRIESVIFILFAVGAIYSAAIGCIGLVNELLHAKPLACDMLGVPHEAWAACMEWVAMSNWGAQ